MMKSVTHHKPAKDHVRARRLVWGPVAAIGVTLGVYFLSQFVGAVIVSVYAGLAAADQDVTAWLSTSVFAQFMYVAIVEAIVLGLLWVFLRYYERPLHSLGFTRRPNFKDFGTALLGFGCYFIMFLVFSSVLQQIFPQLDATQEQNIGFETAEGTSLALVFISLVVLPPLIEEILFRGFMYRGLKTKLPVWVAVLITSALFAVAHLQFGSGEPLLWIAAIDTFVLSLMLITLRELTGSLWASIFLHAIKNSLAFLVVFVLRFNF